MSGTASHGQIVAALRYDECHEDVTRRGNSEPCELPAVGLRLDPDYGDPYPVCKKHVRGQMVTIPEIRKALGTTRVVHVHQGRAS